MKVLIAWPDPLAIVPALFVSLVPSSTAGTFSDEVTETAATFSLPPKDDACMPYLLYKA